MFGMYLMIGIAALLLLALVFFGFAHRLNEINEDSSQRIGLSLEEKS